MSEVLKELHTASRIQEFTVREHGEAFSTGADKERLFEMLRDFSLQHHVGLARPFGSRKRGFWYLPPEFLLVYVNGELCEVFPCRINHADIEPLQFLDTLVLGEAWTITSSSRREKGDHKDLMDQIVRSPEILEVDLALLGTNVLVSAGFGEWGYIDIVFRDKSKSYLLVEVKVTATENDKAIGQIMRYKHLFEGQNALDPNVVRIGIACPLISKQHQHICKTLGITCFELPTFQAANRW
jgi:hypothetical protein